LKEHLRQNAEAIEHARGYFPRGLLQPEGSFRFSLDALLLARFAALLPPYQNSCSDGGTKDSGKPFTFADLGTGCGVIALNILLDHPLAIGTGIDIGEELVEAARQNAVLLGVTDRFQASVLNLEQLSSKAGRVKLIDNALPKAELFDVVVSNPPYRKQNQGRHSTSTTRTQALFETEGTLRAFIHSAAYLVKNKGRFCCIYPAERLSELLVELTTAKLTPKRLRPVYSKADGDASLVLLEARKNGNSGITLEHPLVLYEGEGEKTALSSAAVTYCPALSCNSRK